MESTSAWRGGRVREGKGGGGLSVKEELFEKE